MKTNELLKLLKKNGCSLIRHGSNHDIWYSSVTGKTVCCSSTQKEIKTGTAIAILRDAGMDS
ncbi:MAG: type II toxin-antitoxin system HicA family toxin [Waltera sp.]